MHRMCFVSTLMKIIFVHSFANAPDAARMDWSSFTKGYFLNRDSLVAVLLLVDASVPPQKIDLDCANWLGRNNVCFTLLLLKIPPPLFSSLSLSHTHTTVPQLQREILIFLSDTNDTCIYKM